eukprot:TRINITY_DN6201_c0_g1_i1.p1 TRINITY_DN6201_c0_g1~~TRINITY_DN6201_c0_g1_i1.p1  ORF type:complete len:440 (+),score=115.15 TRINITY_DN6201_c0_g1_i1:297-1616(+)
MMASETPAELQVILPMQLNTDWFRFDVSEEAQVNFHRYTKSWNLRDLQLNNDKPFKLAKILAMDKSIAIEDRFGLAMIFGLRFAFNNHKAILDLQTILTSFKSEAQDDNQSAVIDVYSIFLPAFAVFKKTSFNMIAETSSPELEAAMKACDSVLESVEGLAAASLNVRQLLAPCTWLKAKIYAAQGKSQQAAEAQLASLRYLVHGTGVQSVSYVLDKFATRSSTPTELDVAANVALKLLELLSDPARLGRASLAHNNNRLVTLGKLLDPTFPLSQKQDWAELEQVKDMFEKVAYNLLLTSTGAAAATFWSYASGASHGRSKIDTLKLKEKVVTHDLYQAWLRYADFTLVWLLDDYALKGYNHNFMSDMWMQRFGWLMRDVLEDADVPDGESPCPGVDTVLYNHSGISLDKLRLRLTAIPSKHRTRIRTHPQMLAYLIEH